MRSRNRYLCKSFDSEESKSPDSFHNSLIKTRFFPQRPYNVIGVYTGKFHLGMVTGVQNFYSLNHLQRIVKTAKERYRNQQVRWQEWKGLKGLCNYRDVWCKMRRNHINEQLNLIVKWAVFLSWKLVGVLLWYFKIKYTCSLAISSIHRKHLICLCAALSLPPSHP